MNKGFSLVELIVVIAIMAILVGVAVPVYTSYIGEANEAKSKQQMDEFNRAIDTAVIDLASGMTDVGSRDKTIPNKISIDATGKVTFWDNTDEAKADDYAFVYILKQILPDLPVVTDYTVDGGVAKPATPANPETPNNQPETPEA